LDEAGCLALLCAHPELAAPAGAALTADSHREQQSAGLTDLDAQIGERIRSGNARYRERFGFPFIIAVDGLGPADVAAALDERLGHGATEERATALAQVARIAQGRIARIVAP
jgi:2-oxo-4-hydroxy-4-carboxy-5-ureidoimidazoline decarboxylase